MSSFFVTGGSLRFDAPSYVERQADRQLYQGLLASDFCYVLTSRQMGKSSLMVRTANRLRAGGVRVVVLDLTAIGQNVSPDQWYYGLLVRAGEQLGVEDALDEYWNANAHLGPCQRFFSALRHVALNAVPQEAKPAPPEWAGEEGDQQRLVVFVDEIDVVKSVNFSTDEFFAAIRECYNRRSEDLEFCRITFCLLGVAMPSELIRDTRLTPFNIGRRIELADFTFEEAATLATGLQYADRIGAHPSRLLKRVLYWTGGHPYLTQRLCLALSGQERLRRVTVDAVCAELFFSSRASQRDDNLIFVRERLLRNDDDVVGLLALYQRILRGKRVPDEDTSAHVSTLRLSGVVRAEKGYLVERNRIYGRVFDSRWVQGHMPNAELQRQRAAYRLGWIRATSIAAAVITVLAMMMLALFRKSAEARRASGDAFVSQAEATRVSGSMGQRFRSLDAIRQAIGVYGDEEKLRNLTVAALALPDLREQPNLATASQPPLAGAVDETLQIYGESDDSGNVSIRRVLNKSLLGRVPGFGFRAEYLLFSPSARYLAVKYQGDIGTNVILWEWNVARPVLALPIRFHNRAAAFTRDETRIAFGYADGNLDIYDLESGVSDTLALRLPSGNPRPPDFISFDPSGKLLAEASLESQNVQVWDLGAKTVRSLFHRGDVHDLAWHPQGHWLATASKDRNVRIWNVQAGGELTILHGHEAEVTRVAFSRDGNFLASLGADQTLRLWIPWTSRQLVHHVENTAGDALSFSPGDRFLGFRNAAGEIDIFEVNPAREYRVLQRPPAALAELLNLDFSPDGRLLIAATDKGIVMWDVEGGMVVAHLNVATARTAMFDPARGELLATSSFGLHRWPRQETNFGGEIRVHFGPPRELDAPAELGKLAISLDGATAAMLHEKHIHVLDLRDFRSFELEAGAYYSALALSPDGRRLAAKTRNVARLDVWDLEGKERLTDLPAIAAGEHFGFSPDGRWLVASSAQEYHCYDIRTRQSSLPIRRRSGNAGPLAFSRFSPIFALAISPSAIELRQMPDGKPLVTLENPDRRAVRSLALSPFGRRLAAATVDDVVLVWDLALIQQELEQRKLSGSWNASASTSLASPPVRVTFESGPLPSARPGSLLELEQSTTFLKAAPSNPSQAYQQRGLIYLRGLNKPYEALQDFVEALRLDPNNDELKSLKTEAEALAQLNPARSEL